MGDFFTNIQVRRSESTGENEVKELLLQRLEKQGYQVASEEEAEGILVIYRPVLSKWITVCSDVIDFNTAGEVKEFLTPLSCELNTDLMAISCYDSDYLFVNLINGNERLDAWLNVGRETEMPFLRKTGLAVWRKRVEDIFGLNAVINQDYVFAEDALETLGKFLDLPREQGGMSVRDWDESDEAQEVWKIYLAMRSNGDKAELPRLEIPMYSLMPCVPNTSSSVFAVNRGGGAKGVKIILSTGSTVEDEVTFTDVTFEYRLGKREMFREPIELQKQRMPDGEWVYCWEDRDFLIPPKVNPNLGIMKVMELEFERMFGVRFTPCGDEERLLGLRVTFIPLKNAVEGECTWSL